MEKNLESVKEKFDKAFPEAKILREHELKRTAHNLLNKSAVGKVASVIYFVVAVSSIFVYWNLFNVNIFLSIFLAIITWFISTYVGDKLLIKVSSVEKILTKMNDEEIETAGKQLEKSGIPIDKLLK